MIVPTCSSSDPQGGETLSHEIDGETLQCDDLREETTSHLTHVADVAAVLVEDAERTPYLLLYLFLRFVPALQCHSPVGMRTLDRT